MLECRGVKRRVSKSAPRRAPPVTAHDDQPTIVVGANTQILQVNQAFEALVGWTRAELLTKRVAEVLGAGDHGKRLDRTLRGALAGQVVTSCELVHTRATQVLELTARFSVLRSNGERNLLVRITGWKNLSGDETDGSLADLRYEIALSPFGVLTRTHGLAFQAMARAGIGRYCYEALHDRTAPCPECPVGGSDRAQRGTAVVRCTSRSSSTGACVAIGKRLDATTARVEAWHVDRKLLRELIAAHIELAAERFELTEREREVLHLAVDGRATAEIAATLRISPSTAKFHLANVLSKLGADSRNDLLRHLL